MNWIWALIHVDVACVSSSCQNETVLIESIVYLPPFILRHLSSPYKQWLFAVHLLNTFATANCCLFEWAHAKTKTKNKSAKQSEVIMVTINSILSTRSFDGFRSWSIWYLSLARNWTRFISTSHLDIFSTFLFIFPMELDGFGFY